MRTRYTKDNLLAELARVAEIVGRPPSYEDMRANGRIHPAVIQRSFAGWSHALAAAGFVDPIRQWTPDLLTPEEGGWLAGFVAGEGCFRLARPSPRSGNGLSHSYNPVFTVQLRADDQPALEYMRRLWQVDNPVRFTSRDYDRARGIDAGDGARLSIRDTLTLHHKVVATFRRYPLRTRKQADLDIFAEAVALLYQRMVEGRANLAYTADERVRLERYYTELRTVKQYVPHTT